MSDRPIVIGAFTGLLLNDVYQGLIIGAALEAVFMGSVNIGGQISADHSAATVFAVALRQIQHWIQARLWPLLRRLVF